MTYQEIVDLIEENLASGIRIPATDHREVELALLNYINDNLPKQFDIKYIWADSNYLGDNFEANGLGKNLRLGWALCNGTTHSGVATPDLKGRMIMSYGGDFATLNQIGGSKDAIIPLHSHLLVGNNGGQELSTNNYIEQSKGLIGNTGYTLHGTTFAPTKGKSSQVGEDVTGKNMPPYYTLVAIMKL